MQITLKTLKRLGACSAETAKFKALFGESVELTRELCVKHAQDFSFGWAARNLLSKAGCAEYEEKLAAIYAEYEEKRAPIDAEYREKRALIYAEYQEKLAAIYAEYQEKLAAIYAEYQEKLALIYAEYEEKRAGLFFDIYAREHADKD